MLANATVYLFKCFIKY